MIITFQSSHREIISKDVETTLDHIRGGEQMAVSLSSSYPESNRDCTSSAEPKWNCFLLKNILFSS